MIDALDAVLRRLLRSKIPTITADEQIRFRAPNEGWRSDVLNLQRNALNVYMFDLRENRALRSNDTVREIQNGLLHVSPSPRRIDCHFLITAWSPADTTPTIEPTIDEHSLLYLALAALVEADPLVARQVFDLPIPPANVPTGLPAGFPDALADLELPIRILPVDGFAKYAEFWGTMGEDQPWKPAIYLVVTLPVIFGSVPSGPPVTTLVSGYRQSDQPAAADTAVQIGGAVLDRTGVAVAGAWVRLQTADAPAVPLQTVRSDALGRFTFAGLRGGRYQLRARALGQGATGVQTVDVPSESGEYDLRFS